MAESITLHPPEIIDVDGKVLFLAGPIQGAPDWQAEAIDIIHKQESGVIIASPRRDYLPGEFVYNDQVDWETHYLRRAAKLGGIMFWLAKQTVETPGRAYAQTSRVEFGEWKNEHMHSGAKLIVGIEEGFGNANYIRLRLNQDCPEVPILDNLVDTCMTSLELI